MKSIYTFLVKGYKLKKIYPCVKRWSMKWIWYHVAYVGVRHALNAVILVVITIGFAYGWMTYGKSTAPIQTAFATTTITVEIPVTSFPPMLHSICVAESGWRQFNKDGSIKRGIVNPSDVGICQINEAINNDEARRLGYDIFTEQGNKDFAVYMFNTQGTRPWNSSKCIKNGWGTKSECAK